MGLDFELGLASFNVENCKFSFVINDSDISNTDWRCFECARLYAEWFLPLIEKGKLSSFHSVDVEHTLGTWGLAKEAESSRRRDPFGVEGSESQRYSGVINDLRGVSGVHIQI